MSTTYSLRQAADLTGYSLGKFRYNKEKLLAAGATIQQDGWRIPHSTLELLGWLDNKPARTAEITLTPLQEAEQRVRELEQENADLRSQLAARGRRGLFRR